MFCLRSWIPILFFLLRANASPVYLILFISASYFLNRPCVYCSLLLFILVVALFDFHTPWFEPPLSDETSKIASNGTTPYQDSILETAAMFADAASQTGKALVKGAVDGLRERTVGAQQASTGAAGGFDWVKGLLGKKEWRIQCLDVLVRI